MRECKRGEYVLYSGNFQERKLLREKANFEVSWLFKKAIFFWREQSVMFSPLKVYCYTVWGGRVCERSHAVFGHLQLKTTESEGLEDLLCYDVR